MDALAILVDRAAAAGADAITVLGSTGIYAYLERTERGRAVTAAVEAAAGRAPVVVGVSALRTSWVLELTRQAVESGAAGLLLAPASYQPLTAEEVAVHYRAVASASDLPLCVYDNPATTRFSFSDELLAELSRTPGVAGVKIPPPPADAEEDRTDRLRALLPAGFSIGCSGDWCAAASLLGGADAWHSVVAGLLPEPAIEMTRAAAAGDRARVLEIDAAFTPLWTLFRTHGSVRIVYAVAEVLGLEVGEPPAPLSRPKADVTPEVERALHGIPRLPGS